MSGYNFSSGTGETKSNRGGNARNSRVNHPRRVARQESAKLRQEASDKLTPQERLAKLDQAFGAGQGAQKERAKLAKLVEASKTSKPQKSPKQVQPAV